MTNVRKSSAENVVRQTKWQHN